MSRIIVKNLPGSGVDEAELKRHFSDIDNITDIRLKFNEFGVFRRFAFVGFRSEDAAQKALDKLNNTFIKNSKISLELCKAIKEAKPGRINPTNSVSDSGTAVNSSDQTKTKSKKARTDDNKTATGAKDVFDEVKDESEFKEFLNLQRNLGDKSKSKQVWADDATMDAENIACSTATKLHGDEAIVADQPKKRHKRSRGVKKKLEKANKSKPKELFVHTLKIKGLAKEVRRKDVKDFFKPLEVLSIRNNKRDGVCYASFKDDSDLKFAMRKNLQFCGTSRVRITRHLVQKSRVFKEQMIAKGKEKEETIKKYESSLADVDPVSESGRLFIRNLNYSCTQEDLEEVFSKYGQLTEVHMPIDKTTQSTKGYAYVEFMFPENAARAYEELNGTIFQGRNFHLIPSKSKPEPRLLSAGGHRPPDANSSFKREKDFKQKETAPRQKSNWNILFLGQNALADVVSDMHGVEKSELLTHQTKKVPIAVRLALGDATVVEEMRKFLVSNGIELDSFNNPQAPRSKTVIIAKNLPSATSKSELMSLFEAHGRVARVILPPNGLTAIIEMEEAVEAKLAFKKLAYSKFKESVLYLEWAPINVFREKSIEEQEQSDIKQLAESQTGTKILIKNIPFEATLKEVRKLFAAYGELNFLRIPKKIDGQHRGFGFADFLTKEDALRAFRGLCHSTHLYGRKLVLEWAKTDEQVTTRVGSDNSKKTLAKVAD